MKILLKNILKITSKIKKSFLLKIMRKKYQRNGKCNSCGRCCQEIYVKHSNGIIKEEKEFEKLIKLHFFYSYLKIIKKTEDGLVFECTKLDKEKKICTIYKKRALLCRLYPQEEVFMMGGVLGEQCGFSFTPIESFEEVYRQVQKKPNKFKNIILIKDYDDCV
jgi:Fe-S-cluster containining protein